jgi:hypothetical protein
MTLWVWACGQAHPSGKTQGDDAATGSGGTTTASSAGGAVASAGAADAGSSATSGGAGPTAGANFGEGGRVVGGNAAESGASGAAASAGGSDLPAQGGNGGGIVGAGGRGATLRPIHCAPPPPACPPMVYEGNVVVGSHSASGPYRGVTSITGDVDIQVGDQLEAFDCLESVGGMFVAHGEYGLTNAFPRLRSVGTFMQLSAALNLPADCALGSLSVVGATGAGDITVGGFVGELNLSTLTHFDSLTIQSTGLMRVLLPSSGHFTLQRLWLIQTGISELPGFENVSLSAPSPIDPNLVPLIITTNRDLPGCRVAELQQLFVGAGFDPQTFRVSDNGPGCP